jgi:hypothetical protein
MKPREVLNQSTEVLFSGGQTPFVGKKKLLHFSAFFVPKLPSG